jgi:hypothetical protein
MFFFVLIILCAHLTLFSGAGIGGLALAITVGKFNPNLVVDLYEAGPEISTVGAGISLWKRAWEIAEYIGLDQALLEKSMSSPCMCVFALYCLDQRTNGGKLIVKGITIRRADQPEGRDFGLIPTPSKFEMGKMNVLKYGV